ncbi:MAG: virginiamycin lyase [Solirubrobacteraceae bacterium]|nr:virginiamycin lyase [Solirubrobacteraceae bacterium]
MNRFIVGFLIAVSAAIAMPAVARGVTIREFPIEPGAAAGAQAPYYLKAGPDGNLWIVNRGTSQGIQRVSASGQRQAPIPSQWPQDLAVSASGSVYWTESAVGTAGGGISRLTSGGALTRGPRVDNPYSIALTPQEVAVVGNQRVSTTPSINGVGAGCTAATADLGMGCAYSNPAVISRQTSVVVAPNGQVWTAGYEENRLRSFSLGAQAALGQPPIASATLDLPAGSGPSRMAIGPDGNLWIAMFDANAIDRFNLSTAARTRFPLPAGLKGPNDITVGPDGALWFTEFYGNAVGRITTAGQITEFPVPTPASAPYGIATGPDGNIWFTENATGAVARLSFDTPGGPGGTGGGGGGGVVDRVAPRFTEPLDVTRSSFKRGTTSSRGTTFEFSLSEPAKVKITIERKGTGRRVNGKCVKRTSRNRRRSSCTLYTSVGTITRDGRQGPNAVKFSGRLNGSNLRGTYRASAVATDAAGNASKPSRVTITVRSR